MSVKDVLRDSKITGNLYEYLFDLKCAYIKRKKNKILINSGTEILSSLLNIIKIADCDIFIAYGTLLGIARSGSFIAHDLDIDFGVLEKNGHELQQLQQLFESNGYVITKRYFVDGELKEFSIDVIGLNVDFFLYSYYEEAFGSFVFFQDADRPLADVNKRRAAFLICSQITEIKELEALGLKLPVPADFERYLSEIYTDNWRIPNPNWVSTAGPAWHEVADVYGVLETCV